MNVNKALRKNKFLKIFKNRLHISFKSFGFRWKHPNGKECGKPGVMAFYESFSRDGIEIFYKHSKDRFAFCYSGDIWVFLRQYQVLSAEQLSNHEYAFYRYIAALDRRIDKKSLLLMSLREVNSNVVKVLEWRLNRYDKQL